MFKKLKSEIVGNNTIPGELYEKFDVKRGLRNADGSGVLAGLSKVSSVIGVKDGGPVEGVLKYRGILITELAEILSKSGAYFEPVVFLLLVGRLPEPDELSALQTVFERERVIDSKIVEHVIRAVPSKSVMNKLQSVVSCLYTLDETADSLDVLGNFEKALGIVAKMPMAAAYAYLSAYVAEANYVLPEPGMRSSEAFLHMLRQGAPVSDLEREVLDLALLLHAEHGGGNNSSFTTYVVSSSGTDIYSAIAAAIGSLKGPLHGGANKAVMDMMDNIKSNVSDWADVEQVRGYLAKLVRKEAHDGSGKIYGLGHAVYTKSDPRAIVLKQKASELAAAKGRQDEYQLYLTIEAEGPGVFAEVKGSDKVIAPNVDFFSGFVYDCLGIPPEVYTPMFAMARAVGWSAHRIEEILSGKRVIRPGYKFVG